MEAANSSATAEMDDTTKPRWCRMPFSAEQRPHAIDLQRNLSRLAVHSARLEASTLRHNLRSLLNSQICLSKESRIATVIAEDHDQPFLDASRCILTRRFEGTTKMQSAQATHYTLRR